MELRIRHFDETNSVPIDSIEIPDMGERINIIKAHPIYFKSTDTTESFNFSQMVAVSNRVFVELVYGGV